MKLSVKKPKSSSLCPADELCYYGGTQRQFSENICPEDLRSRIFGTPVVKFLASLPLLGFSNI